MRPHDPLLPRAIVVSAPWSSDSDIHLVACVLPPRDNPLWPLSPGDSLPDDPLLAAEMVSRVFESLVAHAVCACVETAGLSTSPLGKDDKLHMRRPDDMSLRMRAYGRADPDVMRSVGMGLDNIFSAAGAAFTIPLTAGPGCDFDSIGSALEAMPEICLALFEKRLMDGDAPRQKICNPPSASL